jgi:hypothetical protein
MEHCHNTVHEDNAMLLRWETNGSGTPFLSPLPTPICTPQGITFIPPDEVLATAFSGTVAGGNGGNGGGNGGNGGGKGPSGSGGGKGGADNGGSGSGKGGSGSGKGSSGGNGSSGKGK